MGTWKRLRFAGIIVFLGILLNILSAWTAALLIDTTFLPSKEVRYKIGFEKASSIANVPAFKMWIVIKRSGFASVEITAAEQWRLNAKETDHFGTVDPPYTALPSWARPYIDVFDDESVHCIGRGWPWLSLASDQRRAMKPMKGGVMIQNDDLLAEAMTGFVLESMPWPLGRPRVLPTRILWTGFIANSSLFTAVMLLPFVLRWLHRCRRGRCTTCGYDLRGQYENGCPECGWSR